MTIEERARSAGRGTVAAFEGTTDVVGGLDRLVERRQSQRRNRTVVVTVALVVAVFTVFAVQSTLSADSTPEPMKPVPGFDIGDVPVWYDAAGLHRGNIVEQTPVDLAPQIGQDIEKGALALVRTGAVYLDPATGDVWFHPWGGDPRIVGHNSSAGPGGDPNGDIAVWFEESEFVVYDTAEGSELSRTHLPGTRPYIPGVPGGSFAEHMPVGNGFSQVSEDRVAWKPNATYGAMTFHDLTTGDVAMDNERLYLDVYDDAAVYAGAKVVDSGPLVLKMPGLPEVHFHKLEHRARFSPSGTYVLAPATNHDAAIVDTRTGEVWRVPNIDYPWIAWSYGDIAMVNYGNRQEKLLACEAAQRSCESLTVERPILMPTN